MREPVFLDADVELYLGDALTVMDELYAAGVRVDSIVTSPPYADLRDYGGAKPDASTWTGSRRSLPRMARARAQAGTARSRSTSAACSATARRRRTTSSRCCARASSDGAASTRSCGDKMSAPPRGGQRTSATCTSYVYRLALSPAGDVWSGYDDLATEPAAETVARARRGGLRGPKDDSGEYESRRNVHRTGYAAGGVKPTSVFDCAVGVSVGIKHTAPMAYALAEHLVALTCPPAGIVLDPFAGSGTTGRAARALGRRSALIELDQDAATEAQEILAGAYVSTRKRVHVEQLALEENAA
jgi:hypothetical protein